MRSKEQAIDALARALRLRKQLDVPLTHSVSAVNVAEAIGIEVRFVDLPSMEGIYISGKQPRILLSSLRPQGRRMFTCAHEIGHHVYGHGDQFDGIRNQSQMTGCDDEREFIADCFAAFLLMPKAAIDNGMRLRGFTYPTLDPVAVYTLSNWLGVGYETLVTHLRYGLRAIPKDKEDELVRVDAGTIRRQLLNQRVSTNLHVIDTNWLGRTIDCEVRDYLMVPPNTSLEGGRLNRLTDVLVEAVEPGIGRISCDSASWSGFVRVSPKEFVGRSCFRFEEVCE